MTLLQCSIYLTRNEFIHELLDRHVKYWETGTKNRRLTPLLMSALKDNFLVFKKLLKQYSKTCHLSITEFIDFQYFHTKGMVPDRYFELLEEFDIESSTYNRALMNSIKLENLIGLKMLLNKGLSLLDEDHNGEKYLNYITSSFIQTLFDARIYLNVTEEREFHDDHRLYINFQDFFDDDEQHSRLLIEIARRKDIQPSLDHPLIYAYIQMKWHLMNKMYYLLVGLLIILYVFQAISLVNKWLFLISSIIPLFFVLFILKVRKFLEWFDIICHSCLLVLHILQCIMKFVEFDNTIIFNFYILSLTISFFLKVGYHPKLSRWSLMVQRVFKNLILFAVFILIFCIPIMFGFYMTYAESVSYVLFIMMGEFSSSTEVSKVGQSQTIFVIFTAIILTTVFMNIWLSMTLHYAEVDKIDENYGQYANANIIRLLYFMEYLEDSITYYTHYPYFNMNFSFQQKIYYCDVNIIGKKTHFTCSEFKQLKFYSNVLYILRNVKSNNNI